MEFELASVLESTRAVKRERHSTSREYHTVVLFSSRPAENYGQSGIQAFRELAERSGICVAREDSVLSTAEDGVFDGVLQNLDQDKAASVVVCFCEGMTMKGLLASSKRLNMTGRFLFVGRYIYFYFYFYPPILLWRK